MTGNHLISFTASYHIDGTLTCFNNGTNNYSAAAFFPFLCAEILLFILAMRRAIVHLNATRRISGGWGLRSMMGVLVRDSILYFFGYVDCFDPRQTDINPHLEI
jgi:hypothetical protein